MDIHMLRFLAAQRLAESVRLVLIQRAEVLQGFLWQNPRGLPAAWLQLHSAAEALLPQPASTTKASGGGGRASQRTWCSRLALASQPEAALRKAAAAGCQAQRVR
jgi:hypothetical protein